ncbi:hypothetical protein RYX36_031488 [Vicia faba]
MASSQSAFAGTIPAPKVRVVAKIRGFSDPDTSFEPSRTVDWVSVSTEISGEVTISFKEQSSSRDLGFLKYAVFVLFVISRYSVDYCYNEHEDNEVIYLNLYLLAPPNLLIPFSTPQQVPVQYGGLSREGEQEFTTADPATEVIIKPATKHAVEFPISEKSTLVWEIRVVDWNVSYGAEFVPSAEDGYTVIVQKNRKISPADETVINNTFKIGEPGKVVLTIDNQTSKKKKLLYRNIIIQTIPTGYNSDKFLGSEHEERYRDLSSQNILSERNFNINPEGEFMDCLEIIDDRKWQKPATPLTNLNYEIVRKFYANVIPIED